MSIAVLSRALIGVLLVGFLSHSAAGEDGPDTKSSQPEFESLSLVLLMKGDKATSLPEARLHEIQRLHLAHLRKMAESGKMLVAGPFAEQGDESFRGLCLYRASVEEARSLASADPAVQAGRIKVEVMSWWFKKGAIEFPLTLSQGEPGAESED